MTVEIVVKCDGIQCFAEREITEDTDRCIRKIGWYIDYDNGCHYCPECWDDVEDEIAESEE